MTISRSGTPPLRLKSRYASPIGVGKAFVQGLARILLQMRTGNPYPAGGAGDGILDAAARRNRPLVLGNLIALGQIRIEVVLAREDRDRVDLAIERVRDANRELHHAAVEDRQGTRQPEADRTDVRVRRRAEARAAAAEDLGLGKQLGVNLEPDDRLS